MAGPTYDQAAENAKRVKADVARAKIQLARGEVLRSIEFMVAALVAKIASPMAGVDKNIAETDMAEYCADFSNNRQIQEFLESLDFLTKPYVAFKPGREVRVLNKLAAYKHKQEAVEEAARAAAERERRAKLEQMLNEGKELLASGESVKGRTALKRVAEQYGLTPGLLVEIGALFTGSGNHGDAMEVLRQAMEAFPKDSAPYKPYIDACVAMGKNEEAETAYMNAVKLFGAHPQTYLNISKFYLAWHKREQAFDYAKRALDLDANLTEAKELVDRLG